MLNSLFHNSHFLLGNQRRPIEMFLNEKFSNDFHCSLVHYYETRDNQIKLILIPRAVNKTNRIWYGTRQN